MQRNYKLERLQNGDTFITKEFGNSMTPLINSGQEHKIAPAKWGECKVDDIVYCKVNGRFYTHLVKQIDATRGLLIGNNKGSFNGWTRNVYGKVIEVL